jgi:plastocyanin
VAADPSGTPKFNKDSLAAKAGTVKIKFTNDAPEGHNFTIQQGSNGKVIAATPTFQGGSKTLTVKLPPGTYTYFCTVAGHRMAGMVGKLTVS